MSTELSIYRFSAAKQTARGAAATAPDHSFIVPAGDIGTGRDEGSENWSDGATKYGGITRWPNNVTSRGDLGIEFTPTEVAWLMYIFNGSESVAANTERAAWNDHVAVPGLAPGYYSTWWKKQGVTVSQRMRHIDCQISQMQFEGSTANKAIRVTPNVLSIDPAHYLAVDPVWPALPTADDVLLYTEASGTFTIDGNVIRGHSQFTVVLNEDLNPVYTDDVVPFETQRGTPAATIACTIQADADGLAQWNRYMYGTATPVAGATPIRSSPPAGSYSFEAKKGSGALLAGRFKFEAPSVRWNLPDWPAPAPGGGNAQLALAGTMEPTAANPLWRTTVTCPAPAFT